MMQVRLSKPLAVVEQPAVTMTDWRVIEITGGAHHLVGRVLETGKLRCTSAIAAFGPELLVSTTANGRIYRLDGPPAADAGDWRAAWTGWAVANGVSGVRALSAEIYDQRDDPPVASTPGSTP